MEMFFLCLQTPLDYITYIGCSISFLCLLVCIVFFLALRLANKTIKICSLIVLLLPAAYDKLFSLSIMQKRADYKASQLCPPQPLHCSWLGTTPVPHWNTDSNSQCCEGQQAVHSVM